MKIIKQLSAIWNTSFDNSAAHLFRDIPENNRPNEDQANLLVFHFKKFFKKIRKLKTRNKKVIDSKNETL